MKRLALCIGSSLTVSLLLFGNSTGATAGYDEDVMHNFVGGCMKVAIPKTNTNYASRYCHCMWDGITKEMPFKKFVRLDRGEMSAREAGLDRIVAKCDGDVDKLPEYVQ